MAASIGRLIADIDRTLVPFDHALLDREQKWNLLNADWIKQRGQSEYPIESIIYSDHFVICWSFPSPTGRRWRAAPDEGKIDTRRCLSLIRPPGTFSRREKELTVEFNLYPDQ